MCIFYRALPWFSHSKLRQEVCNKCVIAFFFCLSFLGFGLAQEAETVDFGFEVCSEAIEHGMIIGLDGYLFHANVPHLKQYDRFHHYEFTPEILYYFAELIAAINRQGTKLVIIPTPPRALMHYDMLAANPSEVMPSDEYAQSIQTYNAFLLWLESMGAIAPNLLAYAQQDLSGDADHYYFRRDYHWTPFGARLTAKAIADSLTGLSLNLPETQYQTSIIDSQRYMSEAFSVVAQRICPNTEIYGEGVPVFETTTISASNIGPFSDVPDPEVVLVGSSFSGDFTGVELNFHGFLQEYLKTEVLDFALGGGGSISPLENYFLSENYQNNKPEVIIWEFPLGNIFYRQSDTLNFLDSYSYRQLIPTINNICNESSSIATLRPDISQINRLLHIDDFSNTSFNVHPSVITKEDLAANNPPQQSYRVDSTEMNKQPINLFIGSDDLRQYQQPRYAPGYQGNVTDPLEGENAQRFTLTEAWDKYLYHIIDNELQIPQGTTMTFSAWIRRESGSGNIEMTLARTSGTSQYATAIINPTTTWQRYSVTVDFSEAGSIGWYTRIMSQDEQPLENVIDVFQPQVEFGSSATDYQPPQHFKDTDGDMLQFTINTQASLSETDYLFSAWLWAEEEHVIEMAIGSVTSEDDFQTAAFELSREPQHFQLSHLFASETEGEELYIRLTSPGLASEKPVFFIADGELLNRSYALIHAEQLMHPEALKEKNYFLHLTFGDKSLISFDLDLTYSNGIHERIPIRRSKRVSNNGSFYLALNDLISANLQQISLALPLDASGSIEGHLCPLN